MSHPPATASPASRRRALVLVGVLGGLLAAPAGLGAQGPRASGAPGADAVGRFQVEGGLGAYTLTGGDFAEIGAGPAVELGFRGRLDPRISLGLGLAHSWHSADRLAASFRILSLHVEPRLHLAPLPLLSSTRPFVGVRGGVARSDAREASRHLEAEVTADGVLAAGVAGLTAPLGGGLSMDVALEAGYVGFGDATVDADVEGNDRVEGRRVPDSGTGGFLLGLRTSLRAPLPRP